MKPLMKMSTFNETPISERPKIPKSKKGPNTAKEGVNKTSEKISLSSIILFFAFRYALGRASYSSDKVIEEVLENIKILSEEELTSYIREIDESKNLGMDMDKKGWLFLKQEILNELELRGFINP